ncbi:YcaO-like family protein [Streptomyces rishiriensis]|uniref:YcaO-like family protein n=1 Tax=Streptomyces rishiriensis TaxID=68264 RepID=UPI0037B1AA33
MRWIVGRPVGGGDPVWLPQACVRMDNTDPDGWSPPLLYSNFNGLASGNMREEALLHGLYEVLERDGRAGVEKSGRAGLEVSLDTVTGMSAALVGRFAAARRWGRDDLEDAVLERGFATVEDFLASARSSYLYDKARPDTGPLVLQTAAVGDQVWSR